MLFSQEAGVRCCARLCLSTLAPRRRLFGMGPGIAENRQNTQKTQLQHAVSVQSDGGDLVPDSSPMGASHDLGALFSFSQTSLQGQEKVKGRFLCVAVSGPAVWGSGVCLSPTLKSPSSCPGKELGPLTGQDLSSARYPQTTDGTLLGSLLRISCRTG